MAVRIRLTRTGKRNRPSFRLVAADSRSARDGKALEVLGSFDPWEKPPRIIIKKDRVAHYIKNGAQTTEAAQKLIDGKYKFTPYEPKEDGAESSDDASQEVVEDKAVEKADEPAAESAPKEKVEEKPAEAKKEDKPVKEEKPAEEKKDKKEEK